MREGGWAFLSRLVPRRTATVYFILFGSTLLLSITILNGSERLFREFTSCQGSFEFSINTFTALVVIQCLLLLPKLKEPFVEDGESSETHSAEGHRRLDNSGNLLPPEKLSSRIDSPSRRLFSNDGFINLLGDKFSAKPYSEMTSRVSSLGRDSVDSVSIHVKLDSDDELLKGRDKQRKRSRKSLRAKKDDVASAVASQLLASDGDAPLDESTPEEAKGCIRASSWMSNVTICWNSLWMLLYHLQALFERAHVARRRADRVAGRDIFIRHNAGDSECVAGLWLPDAHFMRLLHRHAHAVDQRLVDPVAAAQPHADVHLELQLGLVAAEFADFLDLRRAVLRFCIRLASHGALHVYAGRLLDSSADSDLSEGRTDFHVGEHIHRSLCVQMRRRGGIGCVV
ncbi:chaperonin HSP60 [Babesia caballi]|uniref:Chaperonin HSP60 n=1 Tax=Babesia caballi TaxID=5871 RepID=A0AAV4M180_BABCB|nr:chaperonin HSP60 [Babesia caballi]